MILRSLPIRPCLRLSAELWWTMAEFVTEFSGSATSRKSKAAVCLLKRRRVLETEGKKHGDRLVAATPSLPGVIKTEFTTVVRFRGP